MSSKKRMAADTYEVTYVHRTHDGQTNSAMKIASRSLDFSMRLRDLTSFFFDEHRHHLATVG